MQDISKSITWKHLLGIWNRESGTWLNSVSRHSDLSSSTRREEPAQAWGQQRCRGAREDSAWGGLGEHEGDWGSEGISETEVWAVGITEMVKERGLSVLRARDL